MNDIWKNMNVFGILDHVPVGVFILRKDFVVLFWNRCLEEWTDIPSAEIIGTDIASHFPHLKDPKYTIRLHDIFAGGPPAVFSSQLHKFIIPSALPDGQQRIQHTTVTPVQAQDGWGFSALFAIQDVTDLTYRIQGYRMMRDQALEEIKERKKAEDELRKAHEHLELRVKERTADLVALTERLQWEITERKQAEDALRKSEERFRSIFSNVSVGIAIVDMNGAVLTLNEAYCRFLGYTQEKIVGRIFSDFVLQEDRGNDRHLYEEMLRGERDHYVVDKRFAHSAGKTCWGRLTVSLIREEKEHRQYTAAVCEDITERKKMEGELLRAEKLESVGVLAGGIAHDFNNLLTAILGNTSLAKRHLDPGNTAYERIMEAEKASIRARDLTRQLLTFSKGGAPVKRTASIGELIKESAMFALRGSNVKCEFSIPDSPWPVEVDESQMSRVINNLIINADQAMPNGGTIHVKAENAVVGEESALPLKSGMYVKISIKDEGIGIEDDLIEKIFDPYFTTKPTGSGLGLSTCYSIVKNHNGYITLESQPGSGTTFYIYLPASQEKVLSKMDSESPVTGKGRVLVMDDEPIVRMAAGLMLRDLGYEAEFAKDGHEAIESYKKAKESGCPFDSVIVDLTIPGGMGGKETITKLMELDPEVKAIVSSGYSNDTIMAEFGHYGFRGVVEKPYTLEELGQTLQRVINGQ